MTPQPSPEVRIDKWLWAVRVYRTRTAATDACKAGHVKIGGENVKPSRNVRVGETIAAQVGPIHRTVKVLAFLEQRVSAKNVPEFMLDLTPPEEYQKSREPRLQPWFLRPKGAGRPTKKERRAINPFLDG